MYWNFLLYKQNEKTQFDKKKLENFLKNSMHRNSSGSVKKPSGAQKKAWLSGYYFQNGNFTPTDQEY